MKPAIRVENLSKRYRLGKVGTGTLSHDLNRWLHRVRGMEDPYLKVGEVNNLNGNGKHDYVWALRDINFEIGQGEVVGIIGQNGAGKSTLLKILSRTTAPTSGALKIKGRVASLLEVGTGFHPELTGRENVYLSGAILGMTRTEIKNKFDEIVAFAGVELYIDTPIKRYSSGMYVRLGFAVAAFLEPEILVVDEVLAVGDAEFQSKAIGKMRQVSQHEGRTVLFVSHNLDNIIQLCNKSFMMNKGQVVNSGSSVAMVREYLRNQAGRSIPECRGTWDKWLGSQIEITSINCASAITISENIVVEVQLKSNIQMVHEGLNLSIALMDDFNAIVLNCYTNAGFQLLPGQSANKVFELSTAGKLMPGRYKLGITLMKDVLHAEHTQLDCILGYSEITVLPEKADDSSFLWKQSQYGSIVFEMRELVNTVYFS